MPTDRETLLQVLGEMSQLAPELRFAQMVGNLAVLARGVDIESIPETDDAELPDAAREYLRARQEEMSGVFGGERPIAQDAPTSPDSREGKPIVGPAR